MAKVYGLLAEFDGPGSLLHAAEKLRDAGYKRFDCHSPFPIHGMDKAMGIKESQLGWIVLVCGTSGLLGGLGLQWWASTIAYPLVISGKPLFSHQAFVPITFELTILLSAFGAVFGMLALNKLPMLYHQLFNSSRFKKATDAGFFVSLESTDSNFDATQSRKFLESIGGKSVEVVEE